MGFKSQTKAQKWKKSILSGRFGDPYGKAGDQCRIRESWERSFPPSRAPKSPFPPSPLKALFTRREGKYPSKRVTLTLACFFFIHTTCFQGRQGYPSANASKRLTLPAYPALVNFLPLYVTSIDGIIQFLTLIINIWKIKSYFLSTMIILSLLFVNLTCFLERTSRLFKILDRHKECHARRNTSA